MRSGSWISSQLRCVMMKYPAGQLPGALDPVALPKARPDVVGDPRAGEPAVEEEQGQGDPSPCRGRESGYHQQARVENTFFRYKTIVGPRLRARHTGVAERLRRLFACNILNRMPSLFFLCNPGSPIGVGPAAWRSRCLHRY